MTNTINSPLYPLRSIDGFGSPINPLAPDSLTNNIPLNKRFDFTTTTTSAAANKKNNNDGYASNYDPSSPTQHSYSASHSYHVSGTSRANQKNNNNTSANVRFNNANLLNTNFA